MADESRFRDDDRYRLDDQERRRWNAWRDERDHGRYGRDPGSYGGGYNEGYGRSGYGRDYGAPYRGPGYEPAPSYGRNRGQDRHEEGDRGWVNRAADEVSSWFGDDDATRRREQDANARDRRGLGPKGYTRSDERIREDVCDRLCDDSLVDASEIEVSVSGSEVTLSGTVESREERRRAEECSEHVSGVTHVQNNLRVMRSGDAANAGSIAGSVRNTTGMGKGDSSPLTRAPH